MCLRRTLLLLLALAACLEGTAFAQPKTDIVTLANGDRITGEVSKLERGRLEYKTDDVGTIYFEWDKIVSLTAVEQFEVGTGDGRLFLGSLGAGAPRMIVVINTSGTVLLPMNDVTMVTPIGKGFWKKLDGSMDVGFSYTRSSEIAQLNVNSDTLYRRPAWEVRLAGSATLTKDNGEDQGDDRATAQASYRRFRGQNLFVAGAAGVDSNESLGLLLRTQGAIAVGRRMVNSNRAQLAVASGISVNDERAVDADPSQNIEGVVTLQMSYFSYDRPKTNVDVGLQYFPSLNDWGRQRLQLDSAFKREFWKDVFLSISLFDTFDSRPPTEGAARNDVGVVLSFGWSY